MVWTRKRKSCWLIPDSFRCCPNPYDEKLLLRNQRGDFNQTHRRVQIEKPESCFKVPRPVYLNKTKPNQIALGAVGHPEEFRVKKRSAQRSKRHPPFNNEAIECFTPDNSLEHDDGAEATTGFEELMAAVEAVSALPVDKENNTNLEI